MTARVVITNICALIGSLALITCISPSIGPNRDSVGNFDKIQIGEARMQVERLWGTPEIGEEKYPSRVFTVLQYKKGQVFFTIDPESNKVISKSRYIDPSEKISDISVLRKIYFPNAAWEAYVPCRTRSNQDSILVNREQGLYVATSGQNAAFVSWSTPTIVDYRVKLLYQHCPQRQPPNVW